MKRFFAKAAALFIAAAVSTAVLPASGSFAADSIDFTTRVSFGQAAEKCTLKSFKSCLTYAGTEHNNAPVLNKSRTLKKLFCLSKDETLIIPKGKTLKLTGGADIDGTIYIEKGGKLVLEKFSVRLNGSIFCDGKISVTGGTLYCADNSLLFINKPGSFNVADTGYDAEYDEYNGRIDTAIGADTICFGKTNYPSPTFSSNPVAAVHRSVEFGGAKVKTELYTGDLNDLLKSTSSYKEYDIWASDFFEAYTVLFDGGSSLDFAGTKDKSWESIGGVNVSWLAQILDVYRNPDHIDRLEEF